MIIKRFWLVTIGISQGIVVGTSFAAFISILDIIYRLIQISKTDKYLMMYQVILVTSFSGFGLISLTNMNFKMGVIFVIYVGLFMGIFIGLFASALAEVLNVIPVIMNKINLQNYVNAIIVSMIAGKVIGSLVYWFKLN